MRALLATRPPRKSTAGAPRSDAVVPKASGTIWYMGAKTRLLGPLEAALGPLLARAARLRRDGPPVLLDLFAGTGVVAAHFARRARLIANDIQHYSAVLTEALLQPAPKASEGFKELLRAARPAREVLSRRYRSALCAERRFLGSDSGRPDVIDRYRAYLEAELRDQDPAREIRDRDLFGFPPCLAIAYYRNVYFGVEQAIAIDALRWAIGELSEGPLRTLYLAALLFACSRATSGTSHFAEPRGIEKPSELRAMLARRRIDIWALAEARVRWLERETARGFAGANRVYSLDYPALFERLAETGERVDVVYADPPYTADHYSRFYHVLEALVDYDYPPLAARKDGTPLRGRYPAISRRFQSGFSRADEVEREVRRVTALAARSGAALVWSYSRTNGLLLKRYGGDVERFRALALEHYGEVSLEEYPLRHSGSGDKNHAAVELVVSCTEPRARSHGATCPPRAPAWVRSAEAS